MTVSDCTITKRKYSLHKMNFINSISSQPYKYLICLHFRYKAVTQNISNTQFNIDDTVSWSPILICWWIILTSTDLHNYTKQFLATLVAADTDALLLKIQASSKLKMQKMSDFKNWFSVFIVNFNLYHSTHGIMGTGIPNKFSYLWPQQTANTLPMTTPGRLIQFLLGDWSAEISWDQ